jgi:hypothetical protein
VTEIGEEGFRPRKAEHDAAQHEDAKKSVVNHEEGGRGRIDRTQDLRRLDNAADAQRRVDQKPDQHHRTKKKSYLACSPALQNKKSHQNGDCGRNNQFLRRGRGDLDALHRGKDGDGRRDDAVPIEQRRAKKNHQGEGGGPAGFLRWMLRVDEREHRQCPAFAVVVGAHDEGHILHAHDEDERPKDEGKDADDGGGIDGGDMEVLKALPQGVKRTGADIAEHDPQRPERQGRRVRLFGRGFFRRMGAAFGHKLL